MNFFTDPLRITLLIAGVIVIIAIYYYGRRPKLKKSSMAPENSATHPADYQNLHEHDVNVDSLKIISDQAISEAMLTDQDEVPSISSQPSNVNNRAGKTDAAESASVEEKLPERYIILHIKAEESRPYHGSLLINSLKEVGLSYGEHNIFHFQHKQGKDGAVWFSVANMMEPGTFDLNNIQDFKTKGLSLFMRLPVANENGLPAFTQMMSCAQRLIKKLGGQLLDEEHKLLTVNAITELHKQVESYDKQVSLI